jgi:hypothetical protein
VLVHLAAIAASILLVRIGIHHVLLHEAGGVRTGPPTVCTHCSHLVPTMLFCPQCGVAERAQGRAHRPRPAPVSDPTPDDPAPGEPAPDEPPADGGPDAGGGS